MRILICLGEPHQARDYISTKAFSKLDGHDIFYVASDQLKNEIIMQEQNNFMGFFPLNKARLNLYHKLMNIYMLANIDKSPTFFLRAQRTLAASIRHYAFMEDPDLLQACLYGMSQAIGTNTQLKTYIEQCQPDLIVAPNVVLDLTGFDIINIAKPKGIKTLFLIDNWDNISSKTIYPILPDYLTVWGEQTKQLAISVHGFDADQIFITGTPRFKPYFDAKSQCLPPIFNFPYIIFSGSAVPFDEITALKILDAAIPKIGIKNLKIVYRPHPWRHARKCFDYFHEDQFENTILDPAVRDHYYKTIQSKDFNYYEFMPDLNYFTRLLQNSLAMACSPTTLILESAIMQTPVFIFGYDDKTHLTSPHKTLVDYLTLHDIEKVNGFYISRSLENLKMEFPCFVRRISELGKPYFSKMREDIIFFHYHDKIPYETRLASIVDSIATKTSHPSQKVD